MCGLISIIFIIAGIKVNNPTLYIAAGLFAIGAEISSYSSRKREDHDYNE